VSHHKHSYYLVANSDISGFTRAELELIANLCRYHRKAAPSPDHTNLRSLSPEDRQALLLLMPLMRIADSLDRSGEQRVKAVDCQIRNGQAAIQLRGSGDVELEQWAAERTCDVFRQIYGRPLAISKAAN
jgi:exopolyphosphatase / guanosine-5'-triphosphate,3'-diphosphate pyrophosphatase